MIGREYNDWFCGKWSSHPCVTKDCSMHVMLPFEIDDTLPNCFAHFLYIFYLFYFICVFWLSRSHRDSGGSS